MYNEQIDNLYTLVIVDTAAAPALYIVGYSILARGVAL